MNRPEQTEDPRYGWVLVAVGAVMLGLNFGALSSISVFLKPLADDFGWLRSQTAFAYTAGTLALGAAGIFWAWLADRTSARLTVLVGAVMLGLALLLFSYQTSLWQFYLFYGMLGGLGFAAIQTPLITNVGQWFTRRKGLALGIASAGGALGQGLVPYLARYLITVADWRSAYLYLAVLYWCLQVPLALLVRTPPRLLAARGGGAPAPGEARFPLAPRAVVAWLSVAVIFCCICMAVPIVHLVALVTDEGIAPQAAAGLFTTLMVAGLFGRILIGHLADAIGVLRAYLVASLAQTALVFWFTQLHSYAGLLLLAVVFGLGYSGVMTCIWVCVREMVPPGVAGLSLAVVVLFAWIGMGLGGWQGGFFFDITGDYTLSFAIAALAGLLNLGILGALCIYTARRQAALQAQMESA